MRISGYVLLLISAGAGFPASAAAGPDPPPRSHDEAIDLARSGEFDEALGILWALREADPDDLRLLYDETVVLAWAGQDDRVLRNAKLIDLGAAPAYVLSAVAKSARNSGDFEGATQWYSILVGRDAADLDARTGLAMTHADAGKPEQAWSVISAAPDDQRNAVRLRLTEAYVYERQGRFMEALARYQGVLEAAPGNRAALRGTALVLRMALLPSEALALAREHPGILDDEEVVQLEADVAALEVRLGGQTAYPPSRRHEGTDRALAHIDSLLARADLDPAVRLRLRYDRIVALADRLRMPEAIADFEALAADPEDVPAYVLREVGRAYLHEREPEQATRVLELAVAQDPDDTDAKVQLFFTYSDLHQPGRALDLAESLLAGLDPTRQVTGSAVVKGNDTYLQAAVLAGLARAYADRLAESQEYFEQLRARYPNNSDIRQELANVYRWRGWLDRSLSEYAQVLAVEPDLLSARVGYAHTRLDSRDYLAVEQELRALSEHYSDERAVQDLAKRWQAHERSELSLDARAGESSGQTFGEDQYRVDALWLSRPIARRYRALVYTHDAFAEFPEGEARRRRLGAGIEYRYGRWQARARLSADRSGGDAGVRASFDYRLS
ncbi:MAG: poly-beta-1,6 N-acetyl-D-glucosamine export porin PgaA, partial [Woeseia sp.]